MKRTAVIAAALLLLATFLPGLALYAEATCPTPGHTAAPACPHQGSRPGWTIPGLCGHHRDYRASARLENEIQRTSAPAALVAIVTPEAAGPAASRAKSSHFSQPLRLPIICLTRAYRI